MSIPRPLLPVLPLVLPLLLAVALVVALVVPARAADRAAGRDGDGVETARTSRQVAPGVRLESY
ncbi:hypothetical protein, partial [Streptomyces sp. NPDC058612]|uniref:hypothetical protein n=1 Tax=Streptomyces sp. NPDC058612 TaxID=3346555 RepID=UPI003661F7F2